MKRSGTIRGIFILSIAVYPFIVYFGIQVLPASFFGLALIALLAMRYGVLRPQERSILLPVLLILLSYALAATMFGGTVMLLYYPALVNFCLCGVFIASLYRGSPILLRIVRARGMHISEHGPGYLRRLTAVWAGFFAANGVISLATIATSMAAWTLYNGLIAYLLAGALFGGEWLFRGYYKRRMGVEGS